MICRFFLLLLSVFNAIAMSGQGNNDSLKYRPLTPEEERVIIHKGTERPFTGEYYLKSDSGIYYCKRCGAPLYRSDDIYQT